MAQDHFWTPFDPKNAILKPLLTPKTAMEGPKIQKEFKIDASFGSGAHPYQNPLYEQKVGPHMQKKQGDHPVKQSQLNFNLKEYLITKNFSK